MNLCYQRGCLMFNRNRFVGLDYKKYVDLTDEEVQVRYNEIIE